MGRPLTPGELALARSVYGGAIALDRVRVHRGIAAFALTLGSRVFMPPGVWRSDLAGADLGVQAWFVHELAHVWQFQTRALWTLTSWADTLVGGGYGPGSPGYRYDLPVADFAKLNLEQQASLIEHAFVLRRGGWPRRLRDAAEASQVLQAAPFPA